MKPPIVVVALALVLATMPPLSAAQEATAHGRQVKTCELVLKDGSRLYGDIERETDTEIVFRTSAGAVIVAPRGDVVSLREVAGTVMNGEFMPQDPNTTRLFFGPTGRALPKGKAYLGVYEFVLPFVQVGVTDRFSFGGGSPLFFSSEDWHRPFWLTPKLEVYRGHAVNVSLGAFMGFGGGEAGGIAYGVLTRGTPEASFTVGAGMAYSSDGGRAPVVMVGGDRRIRRNLKLITETYLWEGGNGFASGGVRFFGERISADLALAIPLGVDGVYAFPMVNFVYAF